VAARGVAATASDVARHRDRRSGRRATPSAPPLPRHRDGEGGDAAGPNSPVGPDTVAVGFRLVSMGCVLSAIQMGHCPAIEAFFHVSSQRGRHFINIYDLQIQKYILTKKFKSIPCPSLPLAVPFRHSCVDIF
jgi:hypothetical protein